MGRIKRLSDTHSDTEPQWRRRSNNNDDARFVVNLELEDE